MYQTEAIKEWLVDAVKQNAIESDDANTPQKKTWFYQEIQEIVKKISDLPINHSLEDARGLFEKLSSLATRIQLSVSGNNVTWLAPLGPIMLKSPDLARALLSVRDRATIIHIPIPLDFKHDMTGDLNP